ncbi:MAG TPA: benzoate/H(+) symporter BenE family transporter, partial [Pseudonocardiaceae bacterium]|nr:benzoate/H(+) symporter BenE family transporter [Pseudonocardiaceae bacterium]
MASITDSVPAVAVGFVTVVVGFTSSAAIVFQAAKAAGANSAEVASWILFLGVGIGITTIVLSLRYRSPMVMAWSTPGAALLVTSVTGMSMGATIGAFLFAAALTTICGLTGWFERAMDRVPVPLASALLAGVLVR